MTHLRHASLWISAVHIGHWTPFRCWQFSVLMMGVECRTAWSSSGMAMRRRDFVRIIGGAAAAWPLAARAQQRERMRSIGILVPAAADDQVFQARVGAFLQELSQLGWAIGRNLRIDMHWAGANAADSSRHAAELAVLAPDVILAHGAGSVGTLLEATRRVPIVFAIVSDPVAAGLVESLARPGGNATGFMSHEYSVTGKWLELLKQIA